MSELQNLCGDENKIINKKAEDNDNRCIQYIYTNPTSNSNDHDLMTNTKKNNVKLLDRDNVQRVG
jgi:hypothetical protein